MSQSRISHLNKLTDPLLENKEEHSTIKPYQEVTKRSLTARFMEIYKSSLLIVTEHMQSIAISANWINGYVLLKLLRDGKVIAKQNPFGWFDSSMNQTDRVLTKDNCELVKKAQPGDQLFIYGDDGFYMFNLHVELLSEEEEHKPQWKYQCPLGHSLKVFYPEGDKCFKMNKEWEQLTQGKEQHKCGHEKKLKFKD